MGKKPKIVRYKMGCDIVGGGVALIGGDDGDLQYGGG